MSTIYIIVNESLNMSKGKIASQVAHGILEVHRFLLTNNIDHNSWLKNGEKIVILKTSQKTMEELVFEYDDKIAKQNIFNLFPIYDAGKTEVESGSLTVLTSTPISDDKLPKFIKMLKLL